MSTWARPDPDVTEKDLHVSGTERGTSKKTGEVYLRFSMWSPRVTPDEWARRWDRAFAREVTDANRD
jgi:hypothetical protein